jgi:hypothetical protein
LCAAYYSRRKNPKNCRRLTDYWDRTVIFEQSSWFATGTNCFFFK